MKYYNINFEQYKEITSHHLKDCNDKIYFDTDCCFDIKFSDERIKNYIMKKGEKNNEIL